jgi:pimeloyl-ACP methyl ester carboxylesterase
MAKAILMPQVGQDLTEGKLIELKVRLGDSVKRGDIVAVVESEKATFDVEAFDEGTVIALPYHAGDVATVLKPLIYVGAPGETVQADAGAPIATIAAMPVAAAAAPNGAHAPATARHGSSPLARRLAVEAGLNRASLSGSGPGAAIVARDVEKALRELPARAKPAAVATYRLDGPLNLRTLRSGIGAPVVFIHGFGGDLSAWRQIAGLIAVPNPLVAVDLPGHGGSRLPDGPLDLAALAVAVDQGLEAAGIEEAHFVGHSLGAAVAIALATSGRRHARSLTLIAPAGLTPTISPAFLDGFVAARDEAQLAAAMAMLVADRALLTPTLVRATHTQRSERQLADGQSRMKQALFADGKLGFALAAALSGYAGALRIIIGEADEVIPWPASLGLPPQAALHRFPKTGHMPQLEQAPLTAALIAATIRGCEPVAG